MHQKGVSRSIGYGRTALLATSQAHPSSFQQHIQCALRDSDASDLFNFSSGCWLMISNDGKRFERLRRDDVFINLFAR
jgi:hypothetical protein